MIRELALSLLLMASVGAYAKEVVPGSPQDAQAQKLLKSLNAVQVSCSEMLVEAESDFLCATTSRDAAAFRSAVEATTAHLKPVGPWASYTGEDDLQQSFLYKDGFMTATYFLARGDASDNLVIIQYAMPHD